MGRSDKEKKTLKRSRNRRKPTPPTETKSKRCESVQLLSPQREQRADQREQQLNKREAGLEDMQNQIIERYNRQLRLNQLLEKSERDGRAKDKRR